MEPDKSGRSFRGRSWAAGRGASFCGEKTRQEHRINDALTVKEAYDKLEEAGFVTTVHGKGNVCCSFR
ncbi:MAG: hypothetical protein ACLUD0_12545 [Eubacterium ramulus]